MVMMIVVMHDAFPTHTLYKHSNKNANIHETFLVCFRNNIFFKSESKNIIKTTDKRIVIFTVVFSVLHKNIKIK